MWIYKEFKTKKAFDNFLEKKSGKIQFVEVFVNNGYALEYRKLHLIYQ